MTVRENKKSIEGCSSRLKQVKQGLVSQKTTENIMTALQRAKRMENKEEKETQGTWGKSLKDGVTEREEFASVGEGLEQPELFCSARGDIKWYSHFGK